MHPPLGLRGDFHFHLCGFCLRCASRAPLRTLQITTTIGAILPGVWNSRENWSVIKSNVEAKGTGYLTACFAVMVGPQGRVVGIEHIPELAESSIKNIEKSEAATLLKEGSISIHVGDGRQGWPDLAPYDAIHVGAAAPEIPPALIEQLKPGGRLVIPVGKTSQELKVVDKNTDSTLSVRVEFSVRYVPLTSREAQLRGC
ncbi:Protein-L-isoaspartate O-methyltransferase 2 [Orobanche gracilis]